MILQTTKTTLQGKLKGDDVVREIVTPDFLKALEILGIVPNDTKRVVIDINAGDPVTVYVEQYASRTAIMDVAEAITKGLHVKTVIIGAEEETK
jgi:hypothetical protein